MTRTRIEDIRAQLFRVPLRQVGPRPVGVAVGDDGDFGAAVDLGEVDAEAAFEVQKQLSNFRKWAFKKSTILKVAF